jgi:DNA-binding response OmpR family regulator
MSEFLARVLVVDDNEMNRDMLTRRLQRQNCDVKIAEDGVIALEMVKKWQIDLVLLDVMMPNMNGYETLEYLKKNPDTRHIPVIMISAVDDLDSVVRCIEMGAEDYLFKPFNPVLLKARVGAILGRKASSEMNIKQSLADIKLRLSEVASSATEDTKEKLGTIASDLEKIIAEMK